MEKVWLSEGLDKTPFTCDESKVEAYIKEKEIEEKRKQINEYFSIHPEAKDALLSDEERKKRFMMNSFSYINLEDDSKTEFNINNISEEQAKKLEAYYEACEMAHFYCQRPNFYIDQNLIIKIHRQLCSGDPDKQLLTRFDYRNANDPQIMIGQGYFEPVKGEDVGSRMNILLYCLYNKKSPTRPNLGYEWADDQVFVRGGKFVTEYVRIQPHMDGNKRMALILLNCILENEGYTDIYFNNGQIDELYDAIKSSMITRDVTPLAILIAESTSKRYDSILTRIETYAVEKSITSLKEKQELEQKEEFEQAIKTAVKKNNNPRAK